MSPNLPYRCYALCPDDKMIIQIRRGEMGYYASGHGVGTQEQVDCLNRRMEVTPAQREAMFAGLMFGWGCPGAQPEAYDEAGEPLKDFPKIPEYAAGRNKPSPRWGI